MMVLKQNFKLMDGKMEFVQEQALDFCKCRLYTGFEDNKYKIDVLIAKKF